MIPLAAVWAGWKASKPIRRWLVYAIFVVVIAITAFVAYRGIRDGIRRSISDAYARGVAVGSSAAEAKCQNDYLDALNRAWAKNAEASDKARAASEQLASDLNTGLNRAEGYAREPRPLGVDGCPAAGDARLVRDATARTASIAAREDRLRDLRRAQDRSSPPSGTR